MDSKGQTELTALFTESPVGLVYVSYFLDSAKFRKHLDKIA